MTFARLAGWDGERQIPRNLRQPSGNNMRRRPNLNATSRLELSKPLGSITWLQEGFLEKSISCLLEMYYLSLTFLWFFSCKSKASRRNILSFFFRVIKWVKLEKRSMSLTGHACSDNYNHWTNQGLILITQQLSLVKGGYLSSDT